MKCSAMVRWMVEFHLGMFPEAEIDEKTIEEVTDNMGRLLKSMEYKGMIPPVQNPWDQVEILRDEEGSETYKYSYKGKTVPTPGFPIHEWEKEDEA